MRLTVTAGLFASLVLASSPSRATPVGRGEPRLRDRVIVGALPARSGKLAPHGWRATWDRDTGVAAQLWGRTVRAPGATHDAARAEAAARQFLAEHRDVLAPGARASDFVVITNRLDDDLRTVTFAQTWQGVRVVGGQATFVFAHDRLFAISSSAWPHVSASLSMVRELRGERAILPRVTSGNITYHDVDVVADGVDRVYRAPNGRELARESRRAPATATLEYNVPVRYPGGGRHDVAAPAASITVNGNATTTSATGTFSWPGTAQSTVVPSVIGTYVTVTNQGGALATGSLIAQPSGMVVWDRSAEELADAQLAAYIFANQAKTKARAINSFVTAWLDDQLDVFVNELGGCEASAVDNAVHFDLADAGCNNLARVADVVYHEVGHSLHAQSVKLNMGGEFEHQLSEGLADFFAATMTGDTVIGRGYYVDDSALRDIDPLASERVYPVDLDFSDSHISGLIISGALWDLRKALMRQLGAAAGAAHVDKILTSIMLRADDIGTTFVPALIADDDDGDLGNQTPNYCAIERAFGMHGLVSDYVPTKVNLPTIAERDISLTIETPTNTACPPAIVDAVRVTWRAGDGVPSSFDLAPDGNTWRGAFPEHANGTVITYAVDVIFDDGSVQVFPNNPADPRYQLFVGSGETIYCQSFDTDPGWEQSTNRGFEWQWGPPVVGTPGYDPPMAKTGTNVLGTDLSENGLYREDLVIGISTPVIDVSRYEIIRLQYWRWLTVEDARYDQATIHANGAEIWRNAQSNGGALDHLDREWRFHDVDLTAFVVDGSVQVTWALNTDNSKERGGWSLDDVCIVGLYYFPSCGNGIIDDGETCDDDNRLDGDGCSRRCREEPLAGGGGGCASTRPAPSAVVVLLVLVVPLRLRRRRRAT